MQLKVLPRPLLQQLSVKLRCVEGACLEDACLADMSTEEWVPGSLTRDQDLTVNVHELLIVLGRIAIMGGDRGQYVDKARRDPGYLCRFQ